jgi:serine/threonine protein kinase
MNRFDSIFPMPSFSLSQLIKDSPLASLSLFQRDIIDSQGSAVDETTLRKNLRYLSPEMTISKRVSPTSDIYSFGVLMYEMLTGTTIDGGPDSPEEAEVDVLIDFHRHVTMKIMPPLDWLKREARLGSILPALPPRQLSDIVMRCLGKGSEERYSSLDSLEYDLNKLGRICIAHGDLSKFKVGEVDDLARFTLPARIIHRDGQLEALSKALSSVVTRANGSAMDKDCITTRIVNVSGVSGSGKSRIVRQFVQDAESPNAAHPVVVAWAKLEESIHPPLTSFTQIFTALLDRFLADPNEDVKEWNVKIRETLGPRFQSFISLIPTDYWRMLGVGVDAPANNDVDWSALRGSFGG